MRKPARLGAVSAATVLLSIGLTGTAQADNPVRETFEHSATVTVSDLCAFPVTIDISVAGFALTSIGKSGSSQILHITETDTFSANGNTLVGDPISYQVHIRFDENGEPTKYLGTGVFARVPLPNGETFFAAGQIDALAAGQGDFLVIPDPGRSKNLDAFCAALA
jgi:hypothetical protein